MHFVNFAVTTFLDNTSKTIMIYTVNHKKGGSTFVIITLENLDGF